MTENSKEDEKNKETAKHSENIETNGNNCPYLLIIIWKENQLNPSIRKHRVIESIFFQRSKTQPYAAYKRPTSTWGTHMDGKWRDRKYADKKQKRAG